MEPYFHVGLVVSSLEQAMDELGPALGTAWTHVAERAIGDWKARVAFAVDGPPFIELIEGSPGSPWDPARGGGLHHLAWWTDDRAGERARLDGKGLTPEVDGTTIDATFDYYLAPASGLRIELVDAAARTAFYERWGLPDPGEERG